MKPVEPPFLSLGSLVVLPSFQYRLYVWLSRQVVLQFQFVLSIDQIA